MNIPTLKARTFALVMLLLSTRDGCSEGDSVRQTEYTLRAIDAGLVFFQTSRGHLPEALGEVCEAEPRWCALMPDSLWTLDAWGTPIRYLRRAHSYFLISGGRDQRFDTSDDIIFDVAKDRNWAAQISGCYIAAQPLPRFNADTIQLLPNVASGGGYYVERPRVLDGDSVHFARWYPLSIDSVLIIWSHTDRGVSLRARITDSGLIARLGRTPITARKVEC